jgi:hypothetical protein
VRGLTPNVARRGAGAGREPWRGYGFSDVSFR